METATYITRTHQQNFEQAALQAGAADTTPEICGCYGRACRRMNDPEGADTALCMDCGLKLYAGRVFDLTPDEFIARYAPRADAPKITGYLIDVHNETHGPCTIEKSLTGYHAVIGCRIIEMPEYRIGVRNGRRFTIICDEEGAIKEDPKISAIDNLGNVMLVGNLFIVCVNEEGDTDSIDPDDFAFIARHVELLGTRRHPSPYPMLTQLVYAY